MMEYLENLNEAQKEAVLDREQISMAQVRARAPTAIMNRLFSLLKGCPWSL